MEEITKQYEDKVRSLIKSFKGGNDSAIEELFNLEKEYILHEVERYSLFWPDTDEMLEWAKSQLSYTAKECDFDNNLLYVLSLRWSIADYFRANIYCKRHLMSKSNEHGKTTIQDEDFECLYNHINELSYYAQQGRRLYDALIKIWQTEDATEQIVSIIRRSLDTNDAMEKLTKKFNVAKFVAKYILDLPLSELTSITLEDLEHKHSYYSKAEESIGVLEDMHDELENN